MSQDDPDVGISVKQPGEDHSQQERSCVAAPAPGRTVQYLAASVQSQYIIRCLAGVQVKIESSVSGDLVHRLPEWVIALIIDVIIVQTDAADIGAGEFFH